MAFVITQSCCNDASCLSVCPVNCIHPTPDEPDFGTTDLLHVDPRACIDCGACADACPVDAVVAAPRLRADQAGYAAINADYFADRPLTPAWDAPVFPPESVHRTTGLRVAVVGTGPAACYATQSLVRTAGARVTMLERLDVPGGLARFGVAPDHTATRRIAEHFDHVLTHPRVTLRLGVEVGRDVTHAELGRDFDAVVYGVGAADERRLGVPGEDLPGSLGARTLVGWYTGHPDVPADAVDLTGVERVVVVGNGNVALDAARMLTAEPDTLAGTAIAPHALAALRAHRVREVVVVGRRGPEHAAFTRPEVIALRQVPGLDVVVADTPGVGDALDALDDTAPASALRTAARVDPDLPPSPGPGRRIVLRFDTTPTAVGGGDRARSVALAPTAGGPSTELAAQLVLRAIGYRAAPVPGLPFDDATATVPHDRGRVLDADGTPVPGAYVVGWVKRGPTGGIGDNKTCAEETVRSLLDDAARRDGAAAPRRRAIPGLARLRRTW
ncbi:FAD-dependent oxidoreductase [Rhodococcus aerolatus]